MKRFPNTVHALAALGLPLLGCGSSTELEDTQVPAAQITWVGDIGNAANGSDIEVAFRAPTDVTEIDEFRVVLLTAGDAASLEAAALDDLPIASYTVVSTAPGELTAGFPSDATTISGQSVQNSVDYSIVVASVPARTELRPSMSAPSAVTLEAAPYVRTLVPSLPGGTGGLETDSDGNIYAADFGVSLSGPPGTVVYKITPDGTSSRWATGLFGASGNDFDSQGNLMQSNISGGRLSRITPNGNVSTFATGLEGGPVGVVATAGDTLFVVNCGRNRIHRIDPDGSGTVWSASPLFNCPNGITEGDDGHLYVANFGNGDVLRVTRDGDVSVLATLAGSNNGHLLFGNGVLYVVARTGNRIYEVTLEGSVTLLAGSGARGLRDGTATRATLSLTNDVALSPDGKILYFNDVGVTSGGTQVIGPIVIRMLVLDD
ncbi:MAG: hypothetical protein AAF389_12030 [Gemmatimonadota bacterium]